MNFLKTYTLPTAEADTFLVYWTNTNMSPRGVIKVCVNAVQEDRNIVAELAAMRHLLEDKEVVGRTLGGNQNTQLIVSLGAIRKLRRMQSGKAHLAPYANFLTTRFAGCPIEVNKDTCWFEGLPAESAEVLPVNAAHRESVLVSGYGEVSVTHHVLKRIADRFPLSAACAEQMAWRFLREVSAAPSLHEVVRKSTKASPRLDLEGRYFLNTERDLVLVVTDNPGEGKRLVTTYPSNNAFQALAA